MNAIERLLRVADAYCVAKQASLSQASWRALGDTKKLAALKSGRDIQVKRCDGALTWFSENWPENGIWPVDVPRPVSGNAGLAA